MMSVIKNALLLLTAMFFFAVSNAQDTLLLINGREIPAKSIDLKDYTIAYRTAGEKSKLKTIDPYRVFSIRYQDGTERVIYQKDPTDPYDFTPEQMRLFIMGEQDAARYYHNNVNKGAAFLVGAGSSIFAIYGLLIPPLYSTVVGSFTPSMERMKVSDPAYREIPEYCEGYQRKVRDRKIRNSLVSGLIGFAVGFAAYNIAFSND